LARCGLNFGHDSPKLLVSGPFRFWEWPLLVRALGTNSIGVVTHHARTLQQAGLIKYSRDKIQITDVEAMQETVCECYGRVKSYYQALLGHAHS
jgi:hypothetical protein